MGGEDGVPEDGYACGDEAVVADGDGVAVLSSFVYVDGVGEQLRLVAGDGDEIANGDGVCAVDMVFFGDGGFSSHDELATSALVVSEVLGVGACGEPCYPVASCDGAVLSHGHGVEVDGDVEVAYPSARGHTEELWEDVAEADVGHGMEVVAIEMVEDPSFEEPGEECD